MSEVESPARPPRGFARLTPERRRELAARGGRNRAANGTGHRFTPDEAREAGRKGAAARLAKGG